MNGQLKKGFVDCRPPFFEYNTKASKSTKIALNLILPDGTTLGKNHKSRHVTLFTKSLTTNIVRKLIFFS